MLQGWWENEFGPNGTLNGGNYADKSYWIATETWSGQNYPTDLTVYNKIGGFSTGYVPLFIVVGMDRKVYYNSSDMEITETGNDIRKALRLAIDEMVREGIIVQNPFEDRIMTFSESNDYDVSEVFYNLSEGDYVISVENNTDPDIATAQINGTTLTITANQVSDGMTTITLKATDGEFSAEDNFAVSVFDPANIVNEDYESGTFSEHPWEFGGSFDWSIDDAVYYEGSFSAKSGPIRNNAQTDMIIETFYPTNGLITYYAKVSSEVNYDFLKFYINDVEIIKKSGEVDWQEYSFVVNSGINVFKWSYQKDASTAANSDCSWVDNITFLGGIPSSIESSTIASAPELYQNYPNPFNPETTISFSVPNDGPVKLSVFNYKGELVHNIIDGSLNKGSHTYNFNGSDLTSGVYFYRLQSAGITSMKKMLLIK